MTVKLPGLQDLWMIDTNMYGVPRLSSVYLLRGRKVAVIDSGTGISCQAIVEAIDRLGWKRGDVDLVIATHIHLDHAGGAARLLTWLPEARLAVHERGAKHMANPARLKESIRSARMEEEPEGLDLMTPIAPERILAVKDGDALDVGGRKLMVLSTPGHAPHELCIFDEGSGAVCTGDAMGQYLEDGKVILPNSVLPDFDLDLSIDSMNRVRRLDAAALLFAHFGACFKVKETIDSTVAMMQRWGEVAMNAMRDGGIEKVAPALKEYGWRQIGPLSSNPALHNHIRKQIVPMIAAAFELHAKRAKL